MIRQQRIGGGIAEPLIGLVMGYITDREPPNWVALFTVGPVLMIGPFLIVFWAARGLAALKVLARYPVAGSEIMTLGAAEEASSVARFGH